MMRPRNRKPAAGRRGERGQALAFFAVALLLLFVVGGLVLDGSNLQRNKRQLQNAADAAAFAGAYDLARNSANPGQATTDAVQWLTKNGSANTEVVTNAVSTTSTTNDTITVSLKRSVPYSIMKVLGLTSGNVAAIAKVRVSGITTASVTAPNFAPYAIWYQDPSGKDQAIGNVALFRSNAWVQDNVKNFGKGNSAWAGNSVDFKGFLRTPNPVVNTGDVLTKGGNACGQEQPAIDALNYAYQHNQPIVLPMLNKETGNGSADVTVETFVALSLLDANGNHLPQNSYPFSCPTDFYGRIINLDTSLPGFTGGGGVPPPPSGGCSTGIGACKPVLIQ